MSKHEQCTAHSGLEVGLRAVVDVLADYKTTTNARLKNLTLAVLFLAGVVAGVEGMERIFFSANTPQVAMVTK